MSAKIVEVTDRVITIKVSGQLTHPELAASQQAAGEILDRLGKGRLLIVTEDFQGMVKRGDWEDVSFQMQHDAQIERIAIVSEKRWAETALLFTGKGIRKMAIEHFEPSQLDQARTWAGAD
ncbi:MAG TPA: STAS/SEC14 domain-containing protein [Verrucomicrobiae bacterium]|nr:STAS/SEC14 domain-containing protein [Verrucomicrobiae bacterium]